MKLNKTAWYINLGVFIVAQCFFLLSDKWSLWNYLYLNKIGEKSVYYLHDFFGENLIYHTDILNVITILWGIIFVIYSCLFFVKSIKD